MIIEGKNPVKEALRSELTISKLYIQKNLHDTKDVIAAAKARSVRIVYSDKHTLDQMSVTGRHQGLIAIAEAFAYTPLETILEKAKALSEPLFLVLCDGIEDPHNLGSIIRVAECAGVHGIVIPERRSVSVNETVLKTSAGAASHMDVHQCTNINDVIRLLQDRFVRVLSADMDGAPMYETDFTGDIAIVVGSEGGGIKPLTKKLCDGSFSIPQFGKINSLNASVAAGISLYEAVRQRTK